MTTPVSNVHSIHAVGPTTDLSVLGWQAVEAMANEAPDAELRRDRFIRALTEAGLSEGFLSVARHVGVL